MTVDEAPAPTRRRRNRLASALIWLLIAVGVAAFAARHWRSDNIGVLALVAFTPYFMVAPLIALAGALLTRRRATATAAAVVVVACVFTRLPHRLADDPPPDAVKVVVMTANLHGHTADPASVVRAVKRHHVDVLMLQELTWGQAERLTKEGIRAQLPYVGGRPGVSAEGTGLLSRYPMTPADLTSPLELVTVLAQLTVPRVNGPVNVVALHVSGPLDAPDSWWRDITRLPAYFDDIPTGPVIVGGDFNATPDNPWFRDVLRTPGYADAADQAGSGLINTYSALMPVPLIAIDHVLTRGVVATHVEPISIPGSDHRGILATVAIPKD